ncbi:YwqK incomplete domain containing protein [Pandoravirus salinus]|uniref:YwqK incomplete domain containing protein n=1 Tax=Pandoravirus salinus TaxID=1349410 RepID=S4W4P9_9VIRU|nr:YwqK superfamily incomplete domain [Pandoravirus salinus]AGO85702.1 YwqK incomplete domain containing protein [Pandoravirus salinus]
MDDTCARNIKTFDLATMDQHAAKMLLMAVGRRVCLRHTPDADGDSSSDMPRIPCLAALCMPAASRCLAANGWVGSAAFSRTMSQHVQTHLAMHLSPNKQAQFFGVVLQWHPDGTLAKRAVCDRWGRRHGLFEKWHSDGTLVMRANYENGVLHGPCRRYYARTFIEATRAKWLDACHYPAVDWFVFPDEPRAPRRPRRTRTGLAFYAQYVRGLPEGCVTEWHANGLTKCMQNFRRGEPDGRGIQWRKCGSVCATFVYSRGKCAKHDDLSGEMYLSDSEFEEERVHLIFDRK